MKNLTLIYELEPGAHVPTKAHPDDAGWDLYLKDDQGKPRRMVFLTLAFEF